MVVGSPADPVLRRATVRLEALDDRPIVALAKGTVTRELHDRALRAAGVRPRVVLETGNVEVQKRYAASGFGLALLPLSAVADVDKRRIRVRPLEGATFQRTVVAVVPRERYLPRPAKALLALIEGHRSRIEGTRASIAACASSSS